MASTLHDSKSDLMRRALDGLSRNVAESDLTIREKLALTCRALFDAGHDSGLAGQITARAEVPGTYYTQRLGLGFDEITAGNLLLVDEDLNVLDGDGMANPANRFHSWIYRARPDVNCIVHTHPFHVAALAMLEVPLIVSQMDIAPLYDDCAFLADWPGVPVGNEEGEIISAALGDKKAILLAHHGHVVAGATVEEACSLAMLIERGAKLQLAAMAAGTIAELPDRLAREAHDWTLKPKRSEANFAYYARRALVRHPDALDS
ncbi:aldolase [Mycolicibacterium confluentis]|uniref:Putative class II aldolase n=1 Tax=Mycolicibacterium confluentis TaxID=28047 RepID=A0A7I7XTY8_9MYCO|nr:aldolase [Mycolicibacterium confluentis]MCV7320878.1 aldolase [Mycolicibacterium confluentis]ORV27210.1 class II aldolase [Mycolicibacterium confluentis]BBZ32719.1 putative class II aldolase [Mycolicibacterium confluentis]